MADKKVTTKKGEVKDVAKATLIIAPRLTEKASLQSNANAYTFVVQQHATKHGIMREIKATYKVTPLAVNMSNLKGKKVFVRGKFGTTAPLKKAVVFLKKGDTIALS